MALHIPSALKMRPHKGKKLANSYANNDDLTGELLSDPFDIDRNFLTFLIGGGSYRGKFKQGITKARQTHKQRRHSPRVRKNP